MTCLVQIIVRLNYISEEYKASEVWLHCIMMSVVSVRQTENPYLIPPPPRTT
jgi:hypothetical protein